MPSRLKRRAEALHPESPEPTRQRRAAEEDEEEEESNDDLSEDENEENDPDEGANSQAPQQLDQMVKKLVRLALATEFTRQPLRRGDISTKVLGPQNRMFKQVFTAAQTSLKSVFGMELVELPMKERVTLAQKKAAQRNGTASGAGAASQNSQSASSKSWILKTVLPIQLRVPQILAPTRNPSADTEAEYVGVYSFVVSVIYMSQGARISEGKLERYLARMSGGGDNVVQGVRTEDVLKRMERHGYIVKIRERDAGGGEETVDWMLGPRGKVEVGEKGVAGLVRTVYNKKEGADLEELENRLERSLGVGTFKRKTVKSRGEEVEEEEGRPGADGEEDGEDEEEERRQPQVNGRSARSRRSASGRQNSSTAARRTSRRRRSDMIDDVADDNDDDEEEEEEEDDDEEDEEEYE